jgi:hypothetical protein
MYILDKVRHHSLVVCAFSDYQRRDFSIDCVLEKSMLDILVDDFDQPSVFLLQNGPFQLLAGDSQHENAVKLIAKLPMGSTLMPCSQRWLDKINEQESITLFPYQRYSLDHRQLSSAKLTTLNLSLENKFVTEEIVLEKISISRAQLIKKSADFSYHLQNFNDADDFIERGIGFAAIDYSTKSNLDGIEQGKLVGIASSALVCNAGIEINIMVLPTHRCKSLATQLATQLIKSVLLNNKTPHWDAANEASSQLAQKLGYQLLEQYQVHRVMQSMTK